MFSIRSLILFLSAFPLLSLRAQIRSDFLLADSAAQPNLTLISEGNLYASWLSTKDFKITYNVFGDTLNESQASMGISSTPYPVGPVVAARNVTGLISWWCQPFAPVGAWQIYGQLLGASGDTVGGNFRIDDADYSVPDRRFQDATYINDTSFVVTWSGNGPATGDLKGLYGRLGSNSAGMIGGNLHLSSDRPPANSTRGKVTANRSSNEFMVAWLEENTQMPRPSLFGRIFYQSGAPKTSSEALTGDTLYDDLWSIAARSNSNGQFIIVWSERRDTSWHIKLKMADENGSQLGEVATVNSQGEAEEYASVDLAIDTSGDFVVVWEQSENGKSRIYGQRYSSDGLTLGTNFRITISPDTAQHFFPSIAVYARKIYVVWQATFGSQSQLWGKILEFDNPTNAVENPHSPLPLEFSLLNNYPNPFNSLTNIEYRVELPRAWVRLDIFDLRGQIIKKLVEKTQAGGLYKVVWDATDEAGKVIASGAYFASLRVNGTRHVKRLMLLR